MAPFKIDLRRKIVALGGSALLVCGAIVGHPSMTVASNCIGSYDIGCTEASCKAYCAARSGGALPCEMDHCAEMSGFCYCTVNP